LAFLGEIGLTLKMRGSFSRMRSPFMGMSSSFSSNCDSYPGKRPANGCFIGISESKAHALPHV
jgi:hypothetical protein